MQRHGKCYTMSFMDVPSQNRDHLQEFERLCRNRGLSLTIQRRTVLETLLYGNAHPTADEVYVNVQQRIPGVARTTVYRVLDMLVQLDVIKKIYQPGGAAFFDTSTHVHHHFACVFCDKIVDVDEQLSSALVLPELEHHDFEITESHVFFRGTCRECRRKKTKLHGRNKTAAKGAEAMSPKCKTVTHSAGQNKRTR